LRYACSAAHTFDGDDRNNTQPDHLVVETDHIQRNQYTKVYETITKDELAAYHQPGLYTQYAG